MTNFLFSTDGVIKNVRNPYDQSIKPFFSCTVKKIEQKLNKTLLAYFIAVTINRKCIFTQSERFHFQNFQCQILPKETVAHTNYKLHNNEDVKTYSSGKYHI